MAKVSRKEWTQDVINVLEKLLKGYTVTPECAKKLLEDNSELERLAQRKRESARKVKAIKAIRNKPKVLVDKEGNDRLKAILTEAISIIAKE
jgi:uncharacterized protein YebE (UPF0316 family)